MCLAIFIDRLVQCFKILQWLDLDLPRIQLVLVGRSLQVRTVGIKDAAAHNSLRLRLFDDLVEDLLIDRAVNKAPPPVLADGAGIRNLIH